MQMVLPSLDQNLLSIFHKINCMSTLTTWFDLFLPQQVCTRVVLQVCYREAILKWPFRVAVYKFSCPDTVFPDILKHYSYMLKERLHQNGNIL